MTDGQTDGKTNRQNYDSQDRASIAASRGKKPHVGASERNIVTEVTIPTARVTQSTVIGDLSCPQRRCNQRYRGRLSTLVQVSTNNKLSYRQIQHGQQCPHLFSSPDNDVDDICLDTIAADLFSQVEHWNVRGSGSGRITKFVGGHFPFSAPLLILAGDPEWLAKKHSVINVKNTSDSKCCVISSIHSVERNGNKMSYYFKYDRTNIPSTFPVLPFQCQSKTFPNSQNKTLLLALTSFAMMISTASFSKE